MCACNWQHHVITTALAKKIICFGIPIIYYFLQSIWLELTTPTGKELSPAAAAKLNALILDLAHQLKLPVKPILLITAEFNTGVVTLQKFRRFKLQPQHYLLLGLPLLASVSVPELQAIVSHELSHLVKQHGLIFNRIYNLQQIWHKFLQKLKTKRSILFYYLLLPFFSRYIPYYTTITAALSRSQELEADVLAANIVGSTLMSQALVRLECSTWHEQNYWQKLTASALCTATPPVDVYHPLLTTLQQHTSAAGKLPAYAPTVSQANASHPTTRERLQALQVDLDLSCPKINNLALTSMFDSATIDALIADFNAQWQQDNSTAWRERHAKLTTMRAKYDTFVNLSSQRPLNLEEKTAHILAIEELFGDLPALQQLKTVDLATATDNPNLLFHYGRLLLASDPLQAISCFKCTLLLNPEFAPMIELLLESNYFVSDCNLRHAATTLLKAISKIYAQSSDGDGSSLINRWLAKVI